MTRESVRPSGAGRELLWLLVVVFAVLAISGTVIHARTRKEEARTLESYQMSAFAELNPKEQGTFNDLFSAREFLEDEHDFEGHRNWPSVSRLEDEAFPPFAKDRAWLSRGKLEWSMKNLEAIEPGEGVEQFCAYLGVPGDEGVSGAFLLVLSHHHNEADGLPVPEHLGEEDSCRIWYHGSGDVVFPKGFSAGNLIAEGWREVVPLSGKEELLRLKGEQG